MRSIHNFFRSWMYTKVPRFYHVIFPLHYCLFRFSNFYHSQNHACIFNSLTSSVFMAVANSIFWLRTFEFFISNFSYSPYGQPFIKHSILAISCNLNDTMIETGDLPNYKTYAFWWLGARETSALAYVLGFSQRCDYFGSSKRFMLVWWFLHLRYRIMSSMRFMCTVWIEFRLFCWLCETAEFNVLSSWWINGLFTG